MELFQLLITGAVGTNDCNLATVFILSVCCTYFQVITGETLNVHLILDDPTGNSYMQVVLTARGF